MGNSTNDSTIKVKLKEDTYLKDLYIIVVPVMLGACCVSILLNTVILVSSRWIKRTVSPTIIFSLSLALADAYSSLVIGTGLILNSLLPIVYTTSLGPNHLCYVLAIEAMRLGGLLASVLHLLALAINHYIGITKPLHYAYTVTHRCTWMSIVCMWIIPVCFFFLYFSTVPGQGFLSDHCQTFDFLLYSPFRMTVSLMFFLPLVVMLSMYIHIFFVVRQHQLGLLRIPSRSQFSKNLKALVTTLVILGTYLIGWIPAVIYFSITCLDCPIPYTTILIKVRVPVGIIINTLIILKSLVDPFIYTARMPEIKEALKTMIKCKASRRRRRGRDRPVSRTDTLTSSFRMFSFRMNNSRSISSSG